MVMGIGLGAGERLKADPVEGCHTISGKQIVRPELRLSQGRLKGWNNPSNI